MNKDRQDALMAAGEAGGAYLDNIGKSDLGELSSDEFVTFLDTVVVAYDEERGEGEGRAMREADNDKPLESGASFDARKQLARFLTEAGRRLDNNENLDFIPF